MQRQKRWNFLWKEGRLKTFRLLNMGRILSDDDNDWPAIQMNIRKARQRWGQISRILTREGASAKTMGYFYKAIVQAVLLYGAETWVTTQRAEGALKGFHNKCARYIAGEHIQQRPNGEWIYPDSKKILTTCGLFTIEDYIQRRKDTVTAFVVSRDIFEQCRTSVSFSGNVNQKVWWE